MRRFPILLALLGLASAFSPSPAQAQRATVVGAAPDEVLVEMRPRDGVPRSAAALTQAVPGANVLKSYAASGWAKVKLPAGEAATPATLAKISASLGGTRVTLNTLRQVHATIPNDNNYSLQWALPKIAAPAAWELTTGSANVVVGVVDTGITVTHGDLAANIWTNPGEKGKTPGKDDDGNGYKDDLYGINTIDGSETTDVADDLGHGSHVAGIIGAVGNNIKGIAGVNWNVKIMALKFLNSERTGSDADAIECIEYAIAMKRKGVNLRVLNCSWGGPEDNPALKAAFDAAGDAGILIVCSAGNDGTDNDTSPDYPSAFDTPEIISVAASDPEDKRASFSNYGATSVDLAAPGTGIYSVAYGGGDVYLSGTSMAAPFVSGAAALLLAKEGNLTPAQLKSRLLDSVEKLPQWNDLCVSGGRLNLNRALRNAIYQVSGSVFRVNGASEQIPLVGARIYANGTLLTSTDKDGNYLLANMAAGSYEITVKLGGFTFNAKSITLPQASPAPGAPNGVRNFRGTPTGSVYNVSGKAFNLSGVPTAGINIYWNGLTVPVAVTDNNGAYLIKQRPAGTFTLTAGGGDFDWTVNPASITLPTTGTGAPNGTVNFQAKAADKTAPTVTITKPVEKAVVNGASFVAKGTATDPAGVSAVLFILYRSDSDGMKYYDWLRQSWTMDATSSGIVKKIPASGTSTTWQLTLPPLDAADYMLRAWGRDSKGNESTAGQDATVNFSVAAT